MKIAILSQRLTSYSVDRLKKAGTERGHHVRVLSPVHCSIATAANRPLLYYKDKKLQLPDAIVPRVASAVTFFGTSVLRQFEQMGVFTLNTSHAVLAARDKLHALQVLSRHGVGITPTEMVHSGANVSAAIERLGGAPVIIKTISGTQGTGVMLAESGKAAEAIVQALHGVQQNVLIQKFVVESRGRDIRAFIVGGKVVAAMRRLAVGEEFRSNVHRGGRTERVELNDEYRRVAVRSARALGLRVAGVDLLEAADGPQVMEVNASPGLEGIETTTGVDVAGAIIEHLADQVKFVDVDVRHEPTQVEYGLVELPIGRQLKGQLIRESVLHDNNVQVLRLKRGDDIVATPSDGLRLEAGDELLCYGQLSVLKPLIPERRRRTR